MRTSPLREVNVTKLDGEVSRTIADIDAVQVDEPVWLVADSGAHVDEPDSNGSAEGYTTDGPARGANYCDRIGPVEEREDRGGRSRRRPYQYGRAAQYDCAAYRDYCLRKLHDTSWEFLSSFEAIARHLHCTSLTSMVIRTRRAHRASPEESARYEPPGSGSVRWAKHIGPIRETLNKRIGLTRSQTLELSGELNLVSWEKSQTVV